MSDVGGETGTASARRCDPSIWGRRSRGASWHLFLTGGERDDPVDSAWHETSDENDEASGGGSQPELTVWERLERLQAFSEA